MSRTNLNICGPHNSIMYTPSSPAFHVTPEVLQRMGELSKCSVQGCQSDRCRGLTRCYDHVIEVECPVCYETMNHNNSYETECGHRFHTNCLIKWRDEGQTSCPMCRHKIFADPVGLFPNPDGTGMVNVFEQDIISWLRMLNLNE